VPLGFGLQSSGFGKKRGIARPINSSICALSVFPGEDLGFYPREIRENPWRPLFLGAR
jgi:hypothetical protein